MVGTCFKTLLLFLTGMPAGHPFQGSQPKHLDGPAKPTALPRKYTDEENFDTDKMMRYDDFSNEDVGNIIMDAEPESKAPEYDIKTYIPDPQYGTVHLLILLINSSQHNILFHNIVFQCCERKKNYIL